VIRIREGKLEDLVAITAFATDTFSWGDYVPFAYKEWLREPESRVLVAADDADQPLAVAHVRLMSEREGWLSGARVAPAHRRQGIGTRLNHAGADWLASRGVQVVRLATEEDNAPAQQQVRKLGYRPVATFIYGRREFSHHGTEANGGRRLPAAEQFDLAPSAEAEPAFAVFSHGELARAGHGLYAPGGWSMRSLHYGDVVAAARRRQLWTSPSGWIVARLAEGEAWIDLLLTNSEDAAAATRALVDLAEEQRLQSLELLVPRIGWLEEALAAEHVELGHANIVYERTLV